jgi:hypothetical protein
MTREEAKHIFRTLGEIIKKRHTKLEGEGI